MNRRSFLSFIGLAPIAAVAATNIAASSGVPLSAVADVKPEHEAVAEATA